MTVFNQGWDENGDLAPAGQGIGETSDQYPKLFRLIRIEDETGISGTGHIADGVQFHNGKCALNWRTQPGYIGVYDDIESVKAIHGHNGKTVIEFV